MQSRRTASVLVASLVGVGLVVATPTSAVAKTKKLSPAKYAKTVCGALSKVKTAENQISVRASSIDLTNPQTSRQQVLDLATEYEKVWADAAAKLKTITPDVSNGKKIGKRFANYATKAIKEIKKLVDAFKVIDPASSAYLSALTTFALAATTFRSNLGDPLSKVSNRSVRKAFDREQTCAGLFPSVGA